MFTDFVFDMSKSSRETIAKLLGFRRTSTCFYGACCCCCLPFWECDESLTSSISLLVHFCWFSFIPEFLLPFLSHLLASLLTSFGLVQAASYCYWLYSSPFCPVVPWSILRGWAWAWGYMVTGVPVSALTPEFKLVCSSSSFLWRIHMIWIGSIPSNVAGCSIFNYCCGMIPISLLISVRSMAPFCMFWVSALAVVFCFSSGARDSLLNTKLTEGSLLISLDESIFGNPLLFGTKFIGVKNSGLLICCWFILFGCCFSNLSCSFCSWSF